MFIKQLRVLELRFNHRGLAHPSEKRSCDEAIAILETFKPMDLGIQLYNDYRQTVTPDGLWRAWDNPETNGIFTVGSILAQDADPEASDAQDALGVLKWVRDAMVFGQAINTNLLPRIEARLTRADRRELILSKN